MLLASASPRRLDLLHEAGWDVDVSVAGVQESEDATFTPEGLALENARRKWQAVSALHRTRYIVAADTVVWLDGVFYAKPQNLADAERMLGELVGRTHRVVTGVVSGYLEAPIEFTETSFVTFHRLSQAQIRTYLAGINPLDKAGAYAAQGDTGLLIKSIEGSFTNVVGLPMERLGLVLEAIGAGRCR